MARFKLGSDASGLYLRDVESRQRPLRVDFASTTFLRRLQQAGRRHELVARAVKAGEGVRVLDCTAGLAKDSFILAHLGCSVRMLERSRVMTLLLMDGLRRASRNPVLQDTVSRMVVENRDARAVLLQEAPDVDVIYLDPMFPGRSSSAAVNGEMQLMQRFLGTDGDAIDLLQLALDRFRGRIVLKRPGHSDWVPPIEPTAVVKNRNAAYEVYLA